MSELLLEGTAQGERLMLAGSGAWVAENARRLEIEIDAATRRSGGVRRVDIDMGAVDHLDTFGAWLLERLMRDFSARGAATQVTGLKDDYRALMKEVHGVKPEQPPAPGGSSVVYAIASIGRSIAMIGGSFSAFINMLGALMVAMLRVITHPSRFRFTAMVHQLDNVGWRAVPIVMLITFLIGGIIAQQGIFHFSKFGADIYVVDMVGILVLREIGVLIVAIMVAGRSGSAYTAELGTMQMREEIDALRTMGFDPIEVLILPRIVALLIARSDSGLSRIDGGAVRRRAGGLALWRHQSGHLSVAAQGGDHAANLRGRHDQGAVHGAW